MPDFFEEVKAAVVDDAALSQGDTPAGALSELWTQTLQPLPFTLLPCHPLMWIPTFPLLCPSGASVPVTAHPAAPVSVLPLKWT